MARAHLRRLPLPRYVEAASISEGDTIRAVWAVGDVEHTRTGTVARIVASRGTRSRSYVTEQGNEIVHWTPDSRVRFTLLAEAKQEAPALFD